jgi:carboxyl-terminal processing protease
MITYTQGQRSPRKDYIAQAPKQIWNLPLVLITNRGTASGAEVAAAALAGEKRAEVVGERTYGDAAVRRTITMDDGSAVILSVAKFYSPDGKAIQDNGVVPTEQIAEPDTLGEVDEDGEPVSNQTEVKPVEDVLLKKAVEVISRKS